MIARVVCISVDVVDPDKPTASLAFLCGACEQAGIQYQAFSINTEILRSTTKHQYHSIYNSLKTNDYVKVNDNLLDSIIESVVHRAEAYAPDMILVSVFSHMQMNLCTKILREIRTHIPHTEIIAGGSGISVTVGGMTNGQRLLHQDLVDHYALGEGDDLLPRFLKGERDMLGLNNRQHRHESWAPQINDLDSTFVPLSYKAIDLTVYQGSDKTSVLPIYTSRGCVRRCSFCDVASLWPKFRYRSGDLITQDILRIHQETGIVDYTLVDSLINGSLKNFRSFNRSMIDLKSTVPSLAQFSYNGLFIVRDKSTHPEAMFKEMAQAGCANLGIGVETGSDRLRFEMNKKFTNQDLDYHLEMCQRYGITNTFLMFVGYPSETEEDFEQTLKMLERYQHYLLDDTIVNINYAGLYYMYPNSPVYDDHERLNIQIQSDADARLNWIKLDNADSQLRARLMRDLRFREYAALLRYPVPYSRRYVQYLQMLEANQQPVSD